MLVQKTSLIVPFNQFNFSPSELVITNNYIPNTFIVLSSADQPISQVGWKMEDDMRSPFVVGRRTEELRITTSHLSCKSTFSLQFIAVETGF